MQLSNALFSADSDLRKKSLGVELWASAGTRLPCGELAAGRRTRNDQVFASEKNLGPGDGN